jgi:hypothetical protein
MATTLTRETIDQIEKLAGFQVDVLIGKCGDGSVLATSDRAMVTNLDVELGDVELGDVELGDVELGDVELADVELADVELADVELADVELADVELADVELADVELGINVASRRIKLASRRIKLASRRINVASHDTSTCGCRAHISFNGELVCIP